MPALLTPPPPLRTDHSNTFAHNTMAVRIPAIIQETLELNPDYPASIKKRLCRLRDDIRAGKVIPPLEIEQASDYQQWLLALQQQQVIVGEEVTWHNAEWFFAETYAYRCLVQAARYFRITARSPLRPRRMLN